MGAALKFPSKQSMASRWRRRRMCILIADRPAPAALKDISGRGAVVETRAKVGIGCAVTLQHPEAGTIGAKVIGHGDGTLRLAFARTEASVAFAMAAIASDMTRG